MKRTRLAYVLVTVVSLLPAAAGAGEEWPMPDWKKATPADAGMDAKRLDQARDFALKGGGSGMIVRGGRLVYTWGDLKKTWDLKSSSKSIGVTALGLSIADGKASLDDLASKHQPEILEKSGNREWAAKVTLFHLATQTAGFAKPGGYSKLIFEPGTKWAYSDCGPNWLAECVTLATGRDPSELLFERVFTPIGIKPDDLRWRPNAYRPANIGKLPRREFGSGVNANVDAMARLGLLYQRDGRWGDRQLLPAKFVAACRATPDELEGLEDVGELEAPGAAKHYGLLWWNNNDGALEDVPRDAYWSWGLHESFIVVIPSLDLVISRAGNSFPGKWPPGYAKLAPFLGPIVASVTGDAPASGPQTPSDGPPPSPVIAGIEWADKSTIVRRADGSDNWPMTWADDGHQYTAYGDGWGFDPKVKGKLSLGVCRVEGGPADFKGVNVRTKTGEKTGDGKRGLKASGMLCVDGVLWMLVRNAGNSQLARSADHGTTWTWSDWKFTKGESFGCPTFLNFGRDYAGARDGYVYVYSFDSDSAYEPADRVVLARVAKDKPADRTAWEFFVRVGDDGRPVWDRDVAKRGAVMTRKGRCYRMHVTYDAPLKRYLMVQQFGGDTRVAGGFAVLDAPEPWGPWTSAFQTARWDVGPGESGNFPARWISEDGLTLHLVFSGNDAFSVRKATIKLREGK